MNNNNFKIHAGTSNQNDIKSGQIIAVKKVIQHENYNPKTTNQDLAILILKDPLVFNDMVSSIPLAKQEPKSGSIAIVTGYGFIQENGPLSEQLQKIDIPIVERKKCNSLYHGIITKYMLCAGYLEGFKDSCNVSYTNIMFYTMTFNLKIRAILAVPWCLIKNWLGLFRGEWDAPSQIDLVFIQVYLACCRGSNLI